MSQSLLLLTEADVRNCLSPSLAVQTVEESLRALGSGRAIGPPKLTLDLGTSERWPHHEGFITAMPAYLGGERPALGLKWVSSYATNPEQGLPTVSGLVILNDPRTGLPLAIMPAGSLTALRTGATTAVGVRYLQPRPRRICVVGAGVQARDQIRCLAAVAPETELRVVARRRSAASTVASELSTEIGRQVTASESLDEATSGCEVIVTATSSAEPIIFARHMKEAGLVVSVGSGEELGADMLGWIDRIVVDQREAAFLRGSLAPKLRQGLLYGEQLEPLADVVARGRSRGGQRVILTHLGLATGDVALAAAVFEAAHSAGRGVRLTFEG